MEPTEKGRRNQLILSSAIKWNQPIFPFFFVLFFFVWKREGHTKAKTPHDICWQRYSLVSTKRKRFPIFPKWCRMLSIHSIIWNQRRRGFLWPKLCRLRGGLQVLGGRLRQARPREGAALPGPGHGEGCVVFLLLFSSPRGCLASEAICRACYVVSSISFWENSIDEGVYWRYWRLMYCPLEAECPPGLESLAVEQ